jgi:hypothetical protein
MLHAEQRPVRATDSRCCPGRWQVLLARGGNDFADTSLQAKIYNAVLVVEDTAGRGEERYPANDILFGKKAPKDAAKARRGIKELDRHDGLIILVAEAVDE